MENDSPSDPVTFGPFEWDPARAQLLRHGRRVRLTGQPLEVLTVLLANADRVVSREELRQRLWGERTFVDFEQGLNTAIARLRHCLRDSADDPRYIETVPGRGYRFIARVESPVSPAEAARVPVNMMRRTWLAGGLGLALGASGTWLATRSSAPDPGREALRRFVISGSAGPELALSNGFLDIAISPDGTRIVYRTSADGASRLYAVDLTTGEGRFLPEADVYSPFFSPDGNEVGFYRFVNRGLLRTGFAAGPASRVTDVSTFVAGACWGADGSIVFGTTDLAEGLLRVSADNGEIQALTNPEPGENHVLPAWLPGNRSVVFTIAPTSRDATAMLAVLDLLTGRYSMLTPGSHPTYHNGHLLYVLEDKLMTVPFDGTTLPAAVAPAVALSGLTATTSVFATTAQYGVSGDGSLLVVMDRNVEGREPVWVDRNGIEEPLDVAARGYTYPRVSPDGRQIALNMRDSRGGGIDIYDVERRDSTPLTADVGVSLYPVWAPDGRVVFQARVPFDRRLVIKSVGSGGSGEPLDEPASEALRALYFFTPSGDELVYARQGDKGPELRIMQLSDRTESVLLEQARNADLSPNGRFIAYQSDAADSGGFEIYVRSFPDVETHWLRISSAGGTHPVWSPRGDELFYIEPGDPPHLMRVRLETGEELSASSAEPLIEWPYYIGELGRTYDVSRPDGERFVAIRNASGESGDAFEPPRVELILNWASA